MNYLGQKIALLVKLLKTPEVARNLLTETGTLVGKHYLVSLKVFVIIKYFLIVKSTLPNRVFYVGLPGVAESNMLKPRWDDLTILLS